MTDFFQHARPFGGGGLVTAPLTIDGIRFLEGDREWRGVGLTGFGLLQVFAADRAKYETFCAYCRAIGVGYVRVLGMFNGGLGRFTLAADDRPAWRRLLQDVAADLPKQGLRMEFDVLADCESAPLSDDHGWQAGVLADAAVVLAGTPHFGSLGNEAAKNGFDPQAFDRPGFAPCSRGSNLGDEPPPVHPWDYAEWHGSRTWDFARKYGHDVYGNRNGDNGIGVKFGCPLVSSEGMPMGQPNGNTDPWLAWQMAASAAMFGCAAMTILARTPEAALDLPAPGSDEERCIRMIVRGFRDIPTRYALGSYVRGDTGSSPGLPVEHLDAEQADGSMNPAGALRTFALLTGNTGIVQSIMPGAAWPGFRPKEGWRVGQIYDYPLGGKPTTLAEVVR